MTKIDEILACLRKHPSGLSYTEIGKRVDMARNHLSSDLGRLVASGRVQKTTYQKTETWVGRTKVKTGKRTVYKAI